MRGLRFSIFLWFATIVAVLCLKLPTVEVEEPSPVVEVVEVVTPEPEPEVTPQPWTDEEVIVLAKMLWGEARGVSSDAEKAACVWCALNRVDHGYGDIITVVSSLRITCGFRETQNEIISEMPIRAGRYGTGLYQVLMRIEI